MEKRKIKHIYWFAYYNLDSPSVRYRAQYPLDFANESLDISSTLVIPGYSPKKLLKFIKTYLSILFSPKKDALIFIQRVRSNLLYSNLLKLLVIIKKKSTVYDLDDADYLEHNPRTIHFFGKHCQCISAGSHEIAQYFKKFNPNVIHTTSPTPDYGIVKQKRNSVFTIGWIGGFEWGHKDSLYHFLFPAIRLLSFECRLIMVGVPSEADRKAILEYFKGYEHISICIPDHINWKNEKEIQQLITQFDVGIATLRNHPVQLAKSGIKAKQYMNNGVPVICNDLPENKNVVQHGINGFICNSAKEFSTRLTEFKNMTDQEYWTYSKNAKNLIVHFNHIKYFQDLEKIQEVCQQAS